MNALLAAATVGALALVTVLEILAPNRHPSGGRAWRWINNYLLGAVTWWVTTLATLGFVWALARWTGLQDLGLFQHLPAPWPVAFAALFLLSQFLTWAVHIAFHKVPLLWRFHAVHHLDTQMDASTTFRNHPLEPILRLPVVAPLILLLGVPPTVAVANQLVQLAVNVFSHGNLRLPERLERVLGRVIVTPDFHRLHHCAERPYTDSNYGQAVPWFDYLFGTATRRPRDEQERMPLGLEFLRERDDSRVDRLLLLPFNWRRRVTETG